MIGHMQDVYPGPASTGCFPQNLGLSFAMFGANQNEAQKSASENTWIANVSVDT